MSKAKTLAQRISDRLATIRTANGYLTEIGTTIYRGKLMLVAEDLPCIVLVEGDDRVDSAKRREAKSVVTYIIEGHSTCDPDNPNDTAHDIIADLKKCIFDGDLTFGEIVRNDDLSYTGRQIGTRDDGNAIVAASITIECAFHEQLNNP